MTSISVFVLHMKPIRVKDVEGLTLVTVEVRLCVIHHIDNWFHVIEVFLRMVLTTYVGHSA